MTSIPNANYATAYTRPLDLRCALSIYLKEQAKSTLSPLPLSEQREVVEWVLDIVPPEAGLPPAFDDPRLQLIQIGASCVNRRELSRQASQIFAAGMSYYEKTEVIAALAKVKPDHWNWVIDSVFVLLDPTDTYRDYSSLPSILLALSKIENREERTNVIGHVQELLHPLMDEPQIDHLIDTVSRMPKEERGANIAFCHQLLDEEECGGAKLHVLNRLNEIPKEDSKKELVDLLLTLNCREELSGLAIAEILFCLSGIPRDQRADLMELANVFDNYGIAWDNADTKTELFEELSNVAFEQRSDVAYYAVALNAIKECLNPQAIKEVAETAPEERASFVLKRFGLLSEEISERQKETLIRLVKAAHFAHRPDLLLHLSSLNAQDRIFLIAAIDAIPVNQIQNVIDWASRLGTAQMTGAERARVFLNVNAISDTEEKRSMMMNGIELIVPELFTDALTPADKITLLQAVATLQNHSTEEISHIFQRASLFFENLSATQKATILRRFGAIRSIEERQQAIDLASRFSVYVPMTNDEKANLVWEIADIPRDLREWSVTTTETIAVSHWTASDLFAILRTLAHGNGRTLGSLRALSRRGAWYKQSQ